MANAPWHRGPWPKIRRLVLDRDDHRCQIRGPRCTLHATHVDHIIQPLAGGAWFDLANLRASCEPCNLGRKHLKRTDLERPPATSTAAPSRRW